MKVIAGKEIERWNKVSKRYSSMKGFNGEMTYMRGLVFSRYFKGESVLEVGSADGCMTDILTKHFRKITTVEPSLKFCSYLKRKYKKRGSIEVVNGLIENVNLKKRYDTVLLAHVLEHVASPKKALKAARKALKKGGRLLAGVPNANSIHRQAGVLMGLLPKLTSLNKTDISVGHRRVYTRERFRKEIRAAGFKILKEGGVLLKPLSNEQIEKTWNNSMKMVFCSLGEKYPDIAAELYIVAAK